MIDNTDQVTVEQCDKDRSHKIFEEMCAVSVAEQREILDRLCAEARLGVLSKFDQPAVAWVSPGQFADHKDRKPDDGGAYLPVRLTHDGNFTLPLYSKPLVQPAQEARDLVLAVLDKRIAFYEDKSAKADSGAANDCNRHERMKDHADAIRWTREEILTAFSTVIQPTKEMQDALDVADWLDEGDRISPDYIAGAIRKAFIVYTPARPFEEVREVIRIAFRHAFEVRAKKFGSYITPRHEETGVWNWDGEIPEDEVITEILATLPTITQPARDVRKPAWKPFRHQRDVPTDGTWFVARAVKPGWSAIRVVHYAYPTDRLPIDHTNEMWPSEPTEWMSLEDYAALYDQSMEIANDSTG